MLPKSFKKISTRYNRFKPNTFFKETQIEKFDFNRGLVSICSKELSFVNKAFSESENVYNEIVDMYIMYLDGDYDFFDRFKFDEIIIDFRSKRLLNIINLVQKTKYKNKDLINIFKLNHKTEKGLHFFVKKSKNNFSLLLIDLYHMGIFGINYEENSKGDSISIEKNFKRHKKNNVELERIKELGTNYNA